MKNLADELEISVSVVSRILSGKGAAYRISEETQKRVQETAAKRGFTVNQLARGLRLQRTHTIGLLMPDISNSIFSMIARSAEKAFRRNGYSTILCDTANDGEVEKQALGLLHDRSVDGILMAPVGGESQYIKAIFNHGFPIVLVDRFLDDLKIPYVTSNNYQGAYDGVLHLIDHGHRHIGFLQGIPDSKPSSERLRGYRQALQDHQIPFDARMVQGGKFEDHDGYISAQILLNYAERPTALFSCSSVAALGAMKACMEMNLRVPEDVSLIGFDEYPYASLLATPLTTIAQQTGALGEGASQMLLDWLDSGNPPESASVVLDTELHVRASVARVSNSEK
ncbi:MAG: LacI family transcriptional regulator [Candidatus Hydrogenedentes bacterium]|nr:LacI family transcriptional regulator [Candidatus Hydrogenedentota bacterium]